MSDSEEINKLKIKIEALENEIADAKKEKRSEAYIIATKNECVELRKTLNILLGKVQQTGTSVIAICVVFLLII